MSTVPPSRPPLPPSLARALYSGLEPVIDATGFVGLAPVADWTPPPIDDEDRAALAAALVFYEHELLAPGDGMATAARVRSLLAHWRDRDMEPAVQEAVAQDWVRVLSRYPLWAVHQAAEEWIELDPRRPQVADIRRLCDLAVRDDQLRLRLLRRLESGVTGG